MTAYTVIPDSDIDPDSPVTTSLMTLLRDNPIAISEGTSPAPKLQTAAYDTGSVDAAAIGANQVGQSELASAAVARTHLDLGTSSQSVLVSSGATASTGRFTGGGYSFLPMVYTSGGSSQFDSLHDGTINTGSHASVRASFTNNDGAGSKTHYARAYYIAASPPYNLGDGDIPLFIFAQINIATGEIKRTSISQDPIWAYEGSNDVKPDFYGKDGIPRKYIKIIPPEINLLPDSERFLAISIIEPEIIEIDQSIKNANMNEVPHPFLDVIEPDHKIVLLDPVSDIMLQLLEAHKSGENICEILHDDKLVIGNSHLNRSAPNGIIVPSVRWRLTQ